MEIQQELMGKNPSTGSAATSRSRTTERRGSRRCKISQLMRLRPSDPEKDHFDDMRGTLSVSRSGVYFQTSEPAYEIGMRLFVTLPYSQDPMSLNREFLAEVVRRDPLPTGMFGVGLKILMDLGMQQPILYGYSFYAK
ncbi:MAG TPA: PilZ domain-containing protein [Candidatus Acidoferrum sp.]|nr:PilZ domain-containing protein [Candidatus Acidoferrum sp.]